jgi:hypothetical protein
MWQAAIMTTKTFAAFAALLILPIAAGCGDARLTESVGALKTAATDVAKDAVAAAGDVVDTRTVCVIAGQSEAFCGCLQGELGSRIEPGHIDALTGVVRATLQGGVDEAVKSAAGIDPDTRAALTRCAVRGAVSEAVAQ